MEEPKVSVIIPCFNSEKYLPLAIQSINYQNSEHLEIIIIDDGSTDQSVQIASTFPNVKLITQANTGPSSARNKGLHAAKGNYIGFLDADDEYPTNKLSLQMDYLTKNKEADFVSGRIQCIGTGSDYRFVKSYEDVEKKIMRNFHLGANLYRRSVFDKIGNFDEELRFAEDVDHWYKILEQNLKFEFLEEVTLLHRRHEENMTNKSRSAENSYFIKALKKSLDRRKNLNSEEMSSFFKKAPFLSQSRIG